MNKTNKELSKNMLDNACNVSHKVGARTIIKPLLLLFAWYILTIITSVLVLVKSDGDYNWSIYAVFILCAIAIEWTFEIMVLINEYFFRNKRWIKHYGVEGDREIMELLSKHLKLPLLDTKERTSKEWDGLITKKMWNFIPLVTLFIMAIGVFTWVSYWVKKNIEEDLEKLKETRETDKENYEG